MIKGIILDIDGVIIGDKIGYNSPYPHPDVIQALRTARESGVFISLCTAKPYFAIETIIHDAHLQNLHIVDGGAVIIDPITNNVFVKHSIPTLIAKDVCNALKSANIYTEIYTIDRYMIDYSHIQPQGTTGIHTHILETEPVVSDNLVEEIPSLEITKIMPVAENEKQKELIIQTFQQFSDQLTLSWGIHPVALPRQFGIITAKSISKESAALAIMSHEQVSSDHLLGVGDGTSDWQFMNHCQYVAAMGNASDELKDNVLARQQDGFIAADVDENGIIGVFQHFNILT